MEDPARPNSPCFIRDSTKVCAAFAATYAFVGALVAVLPMQIAACGVGIVGNICNIGWSVYDIANRRRLRPTAAVVFLLEEAFLIMFAVELVSRNQTSVAVALFGSAANAVSKGFVLSRSARVDT